MPTPVLAFDVERWADIQMELMCHFPAHWEEVAMDRATVKLAPDWERYITLENDGMLHVVTARVDEQLVGYVVCIVGTHLHYRDTIHAFPDLYYLAPEYRRGWNAVRLFRYVEETLAERGVQKMIQMTKRHKDMSRLFEYMGWTATETVFTKFIG